MPTRRPSTAALAFLMAAVTIFFWASAFSGVKVGLTGFGAGEFALYRFLVAGVVLGGYAAATGLKPPPARLLPKLALLGALGVAAYHTLLNWGQQSVPAGTASLLIATVPVFTALICWRLYGEGLGRAGWVGTGISLLGVLLIVLGRGQEIGFGLGAGLILGAALCGALYFALQRPYMPELGPLRFTAYSLMLGTLPLLVFAPNLAKQFAAAPLAAHLAAVYTGAFSAALAYLTWSYAIHQLGAVRVSNLLFFSPVIALVVAYFAVGEVPSWLTLLGGAVAIAGVVVVNFRGRKG